MAKETCEREREAKGWNGRRMFLKVFICRVTAWSTAAFVKWRRRLVGKSCQTQSSETVRRLYGGSSLQRS